VCEGEKGGGRKKRGMAVSRPPLFTGRKRKSGALLWAIGLPGGGGGGKKGPFGGKRERQQQEALYFHKGEGKTSKRARRPIDAVVHRKEGTGRRSRAGGKKKRGDKIPLVHGGGGRRGRRGSVYSYCKRRKEKGEGCRIVVS